MATTATGVGRLEEEALRRKERLKALREKTGRKDKRNRAKVQTNMTPLDLEEIGAWQEGGGMRTTKDPDLEENFPMETSSQLPFLCLPEYMARMSLAYKLGPSDKEDGEPKTKQLREGEEEGEKHRELRLRNYVPEDEDLKKRRVPQAKPVAVEEKVKEQLEAAKPEPVIEEVDLANLAPRKPDWDLKRDVAKKLEKLEKRTQRAIAELIRERLKGQEDSLASAVNATTEQETCDSD
ncbi:Coiled-coil domain-containing protein 12 [Galemys pyrenaicus]|uniref:Coiled-coil domain-containing protein 12 n=1 Tax=Galemys pyrenaicus TaxID=202257 RepID=A0A8J6ALH9_GALPY|nr:Coiled-coil domain-containing protein 12 [Galemys pyrenaicus]